MRERERDTVRSVSRGLGVLEVDLRAFWCKARVRFI